MRVDYEKHMLTHSNEKFVACSLCNRTYPKVQLLSVHLSTHMKRKNHKCFHCNREFTWKNNLYKHMKTHKNSYDDHICFYCNFRCQEKINLTKHISLVHPEEKSKWKTWHNPQFINMNSENVEKRAIKNYDTRSYCELRCTCLYNFKKHISIHIKKNEFIRKNNDEKLVLVDQLRTSAIQLPENKLQHELQCSCCKQQFKSKTELSEHLKKSIAE